MGRKKKPINSGSKAQPVYRCTKCSRDFSNKRQLNTHIEKCDGTETGKMIACQFCPAFFQHKRNYLDHLFRDHKEKSFDNDVTPEIARHRLFDGMPLLEPFHRISSPPNYDTPIQTLQSKDHDYDNTIVPEAKKRKVNDSCCNSINAFFDYVSSVKISTDETRTMMNHTAKIPEVVHNAAAVSETNKEMSSLSENTESVSSSDENDLYHWAVLWPQLKEKKWTCVKAKNPLHDWYYVPPNVDIRKSKIDIDYFRSPDAVIEYVKANADSTKSIIVADKGFQEEPVEICNGSTSNEVAKGENNNSGGLLPQDVIVTAPPAPPQETYERPVAATFEGYKSTYFTFVKNNTVDVSLVAALGINVVGVEPSKDLIEHVVRKHLPGKILYNGQKYQPNMKVVIKSCLILDVLESGYAYRSGITKSSWLFFCEGDPDKNYTDAFRELTLHLDFSETWQQRLHLDFRHLFFLVLSPIYVHDYLAIKENGSLECSLSASKPNKYLIEQILQTKLVGYNGQNYIYEPTEVKYNGQKYKSNIEVTKSCRVREVFDNGLAQRAGLKVNDWIFLCEHNTNENPTEQRMTGVHLDFESIISHIDSGVRPLHILVFRLKERKLLCNNANQSVDKVVQENVDAPVEEMHKNISPDKNQHISVASNFDSNVNDVLDDDDKTKFEIGAKEESREQIVVNDDDAYGDEVAPQQQHVNASFALETNVPCQNEEPNKKVVATNVATYKSMPNFLLDNEEPNKKVVATNVATYKSMPSFLLDDEESSNDSGNESFTSSNEFEALENLNKKVKMAQSAYARSQSLYEKQMYQFIGTIPDAGCNANNYKNAAKSMVDDLNPTIDTDALAPTDGSVIVINNELMQMKHDLDRKHIPVDDVGKNISVCEIELLDMLSSCNAPLHLFDDILKWSRRSVLVHKYDFEQQPPSRSKVMRSLIYKNQMKDLIPNTTEFFLPNAKQTINIITHDITASIFSLLNDAYLMQDENLIFVDNPLENPNDHPKEKINDINFGSCYKKAYKRYCKNPGKDVLCPLIFFIDKTFTDARGLITLEPIWLTLGIFNQSARNRPDAWRVIGFVPSLSNINNKNLTSGQRLDDYHSILRMIFTPLKKLQSYDGLAWKLNYRNSLFDVVFKIPILFITGDSEGHDKLVGRKKQYNLLVENRHICRYCNVSMDQCDNPTYVNDSADFEYTKSSTVRKLLELADENSDKKLSDLGYYRINRNVFHELKFCDRKHGLNGSLPADLLHTYQLGIYTYAIEQFFKQKKANVTIIRKLKKEEKQGNTKKKVACSKAKNDGEIYVCRNEHGALEKKHLSSLLVFNKSECDKLNTMASYYGKQLSHQSDRNLPRAKFSDLSSERKKNGHEYQGVLLNLLVIMVSSHSEYLKQRFGGEPIGRKRWSSWVLLFERLIMVEEFLKQESFVLDSVSMFKRWFTALLQLYKNVIDRDAGNGLKILKYHLCTHFADDIRKWGPPSAYDSSIGESNHKVLKRQSKKTQKRVRDVFECQTGIRYVEDVALQTTLNNLSQNNSNFVDKQFTDTCSDNGIDNCFSGCSYFVDQRGMHHTKKQGSTVEERACFTWKQNPVLQNEIQNLINLNFLPRTVSKKIDLMTVFKKNDILYRGDPDYKGENWHDWAYCDWGPEFGMIPVQIIIFIDLSELQGPFPLEIGNVQIQGAGHYAIVHMVEHPLDSEIIIDKKQTKNFKAFKLSRIMYVADKIIDTQTRRPIIAFVNVESLHEPCVAVSKSQLEIDSVQPNANHSFIFIAPRSSWPKRLEDAMKEDIQNKSIG